MPVICQQDNAEITHGSTTIFIIFYGTYENEYEHIEPTTISLVDVTWLYIHLQNILKIVPMQSLAWKVFRNS